MHEGTRRAVGNGGAQGVRHGRDTARVLLGGLAVLAGLVVIGGGIVLFLTTLIR